MIFHIIHLYLPSFIQEQCKNVKTQKSFFVVWDGFYLRLVSFKLTNGQLKLKLQKFTVPEATLNLFSCIFLYFSCSFILKENVCQRAARNSGSGRKAGTARNLNIDIIKGLVLAHQKIRLLHIFFPFVVIPKKSNNKVFFLITQRQILSDFLGPLTQLNFLLGRQGGWGAQLPHLRRGLQEEKIQKKIISFRAGVKIS